MAYQISFFLCESGSFYACDYGSRFLGCCIDNNVERVCGQGCDAINITPAVFDVTFFQYLNNGPSGICEKAYQWNVCPEPAEGDWAFFGCYLTNEAPCDYEDFSNSYVGNASTPMSLEDGDPYPLILEDVTAAASTSISSSSTGSAVSSTLGSTASHIHSVSASPTNIQSPSRATIGAVAGGFTGGLVATAALLGCLILYYRRRKTCQAKSTVPDSEPTIEDSIPLTPAPAYTTSSEKTVPTERVPNPVLMRELGISDSPPRPVSELSSPESAYFSSRTSPAQLSNTGFVPYPAKRTQGQEASLTNSSGNFPHAIPGISDVGEVI